MNDFLTSVCASAADRVAAARRIEPIEALRERATATPTPPPFGARLRGGAVIAEVKRASPSRGVIAADRDAAAQAQAYVAGGAAAVSVLTEPEHFAGSLDDLRAVTARVDVPVLRKDFVVDAYQVLEARAAGAAAVLLLVAALTPTRLRELIAAARAAGVEPLIETHDLAEARRAAAALAALPPHDVAPVVGVNARDLRTLAVDRGVFASVLAALPDDVVVVAESGVTGPADATRYVLDGADAVLVGEHLMLADDPAAATRVLVDAVRTAGSAASPTSDPGDPVHTMSHSAADTDDGHYGRFGGRFVPEVLVTALDELTDAFAKARVDPSFADRMGALRRDYGGRPTPLYLAERLTAHAGGARIHLKREDLAHTGSHKLCNVLGQGLLADRMGKRRLIAETGAGQHGVATATIAALLGMECRVYMGEEDCRRQRLNVVRMQLMGAEVVPVTSGTRTLKDAINETMRDWVTNVETTHYLLGSVVGPHPFPLLVREFVKVIGEEVREQILRREGRLPDAVVACVGGGSNAMGVFHPFVADPDVRLVGVEAGGHGVESGEHSATIVAGSEGILHGARSMVLQDDHGQVHPTHSISAGLDYPGVGPEHAWLADSGRATYRAATDDDALAGFRLLCELEGIIPALEPAHAIVPAVELARELGPDGVVVVNLSGRGDKDVDEVARVLAMSVPGHDGPSPGAAR